MSKGAPACAAVCDGTLHLVVLVPNAWRACAVRIGVTFRVAQPTLRLGATPTWSRARSLAIHPDLDARRPSILAPLLFKAFDFALLVAGLSALEQRPADRACLCTSGVEQRLTVVRDAARTSWNLAACS